MHEAIQFQNVIQQFQPKLSVEYRGTSPRNAIPGTEVRGLMILLMCLKQGDGYANASHH